MKIRLLENIRLPHVSGTRGEVVDVEAKLAEHLEKHGQAAFLARETKRPIAETKADPDETISAAGEPEDEKPEPEAKKSKGKR